MLHKLFDAAYFLFKNEIAHTTNWQALLTLLGQTDFSGRIQSFLSTRPRNATYQSTTAISDILQSLSVALDTQLTSRLQMSVEKLGMFALMSDEETNIKNEQVLSTCVRYLSCESQSVVEQFVAVSSLQNATAETVTAAIGDVCRSRSIDMTKIVALSFDGASNMSGQRGGVQALLKDRYCPRAVFIHCRSHRLQLALKNAANKNKTVKGILATLGSFYKLFSQSPKNLRQLHAIEESLELPKLKAIEPSPTRWLGYEQCVKRMLEIYPAVIATLEHLYVDSCDLSATAGGLLLTLRKQSTIFLLTVLDDWLRALARLSRMFQTACEDLSPAITVTQTTISHIEEFDFQVAVDKCAAVVEACTSKGLHIELDSLSDRGPLNAFRDAVVRDLRCRFSDDTARFLVVYKMFSRSAPDSTFTARYVQSVVANAPVDISAADVTDELQIFRRWVGSAANNTPNQIMRELAFGPQAMLFPAIAKLAVAYLLLPLWTATVERSFSTLNRIACAERSSLNADHQDCLMRISAEGPDTLSPELLDSAINEWCKTARRLKD